MKKKKLAAWTSRGTYRHNNISCQILQSFVFVIHHWLLKIPTLARGPQVVASGLWFWLWLFARSSSGCSSSEVERRMLSLWAVSWNNTYVLIKFMQRMNYIYQPVAQYPEQTINVLMWRMLEEECSGFPLSQNKQM